MAFDLLDWSPYTYFVKPGSRLGAVSSSRGCTYTCGFCSQTQFWEKSWRGRAPECVAAEIADLKSAADVYRQAQATRREDEAWQEKAQDVMYSAQRGAARAPKARGAAGTRSVYDRGGHIQ